VGILLPDSAFEAVAPASGAVGEVGEEIEVGIAGDFGMIFEELFELGIAAGDVVLIGEEGGIVGDDLGEGGSHAEETHELGAGVGDVAFVGEWGGWRWGSGFGWLERMTRSGCEKEEQ
jgi:hypothetical protein